MADARTLRETDPEVHAAIAAERARQNGVLELIAVSQFGGALLVLCQL